MASGAQLAADTLVGRDFRILSVIGTGGMGTVYLAEQLSTGRKRALKVMHDRWLDDDKHRERFVREAKVGARVQSAHVADVIAAGTEDDGTAWIAMELLEGGDLAAFLSHHGPLSPAELLEMFEQICHAIAAAHRADLVHRDIKPENIYVTLPREARARPLVKVLDFGIAKLVAQARSGTTASVGSPAWMAPEQADTKVAITAATDVWALGLLAFWLLTGKSYWTAVHEPELSIRAVMKEILFDDLPLASRRAAELEVTARLPRGFDDWFDRCVHREPRARFDDAEALFQSLRKLLGGDDSEGQSDDPTDKAVASDGGDDVAQVAAIPMSTEAFLRQSGIGQLDEPPSDAADDTSDEDGASEADRDDEADSDDGDQPADDESASESVAPLPEGRTSEPGVIASRSPEPTSRRGLLLGGLAVALVVAAMVWLLPSQPDPASGPSTAATAQSSSATSQTSSPLTTGPADDAAQPPASGTSAATASASGGGRVASRPPDAPTATPTATPSASASVTASSSASASGRPGRPFPQQMAMRSISLQADTARRRCSGKAGPKTWSGTVTFGPRGKVIRVQLDDNRNRATTNAHCVRWTMQGAATFRYDGGEETLPFLVNLD